MDSPERTLVGPRRSRWRAPGRVNVIGEHTDYNAGLALPFAIDRTCTATARVIDYDGVLVRSAQRPQQISIGRHELVPGQVTNWGAYAAGVAWAIAERGVQLPGLMIEVDSNVPYGSGLSSSAALTCSVAGALNDLLDLGFGPLDLLAITMAAENDFADAPTGGMDQLTALLAVAGQALLCDMRTNQTELVPFDLDPVGLAFLVVDSKAEHRNSESEYRQRREGCERAAAQLGLASLRDVDDLTAALRALESDKLRRYTRHVVTENQRVRDIVALLTAGDIHGIGPLLTESHVSLRDDYRISIPQLDVAVAELLTAGALGAHMTGGGFGGSVIALIAADRVAAAGRAVAEAYERHGFTAPVSFTCRPSRGAHRVD
jgi:galactokinase